MYCRSKSPHTVLAQLAQLESQALVHADGSMLGGAVVHQPTHPDLSQRAWGMAGVRWLSTQRTQERKHDKQIAFKSSQVTNSGNKRGEMTGISDVRQYL